MSVAVELSGLAERCSELGPVAYLVTVNEVGRPHVVSVRPRLEVASFLVAAGPRTTENATRRPGVTLLWPAPEGAGYCLIVDGLAERVGAGATAEEATLEVRPSRAVLHRTPEGDPSAPSCITVLSEP